MFQKCNLAILTTVFAIGFTAPAFADCASDLEQVNAALETISLSEADRATIEAAKMAAEDKLDAGDEEGCQADLIQIKSALQIN